MTISRETRIGIFVISVLTAAFFAINYLRGEDIFGTEIEICSHYANIEGLVPSNPVYVKGYKAESDWIWVHPQRLPETVLNWLLPMPRIW